MTPLGHASIGAIAGVGLSAVIPEMDKTTIIAATSFGGVALDFDLLYRFYQKGGEVLDGTIGEHRFFPTHTPLFVLILTFFLVLLTSKYIAFAFAVGAFVHLFLDTLFFPEGINFTYPFNKKMTSILTVTTHKFWAPKRISQVDGWWKNYFSSPLFWAVEVLPALIAIVLLWRLL